MNHKRKKESARKMMTQEEIANNTPIFESKAWEERKLAKAKKQSEQGKKHVHIEKKDYGKIIKADTISINV